MKELLSVNWVQVSDNKVLCVKSRGKDKFFIPGGKLEFKESKKQALLREIKEELCVILVEETIEHLVTIRDVAYGLDNTVVKMFCYQSDFIGEITESSEIEVARWIGLEDIELCAPAAQKLLRFVLVN